jgi:ATP synthase protein I
VTASVGVLVSIVGAVVSSLPGLISSVTAMAVVVVFFGISLLVAAFVGHRAPKAIMAAFMLTYVVKVIGFGALLLVPHDPAWFSKLWMTVSAVVSVVVWQAVEVYLFSRLRLQIFADVQASPEPKGA